MSKQEIRVKKAHIALMKHPETALYSGVMLMGKSEVVDDGCPTAYTDGVNKVYGRKFLEGVDTEPKVRGLVLHENLHVALKQLPRGKDMFDENRKLANIAADLVVNNIIEDIKGTVNGSSERIVALPDGAVYDPMFQNWSMREIYNYLKKNCKGGKKGKGGGGGGKGNDPADTGSGDSGDDDDDTITINGKTYDLSDADEHDLDNLKDLTHGEIKEINDAIDKALREGGMLAGRMGAKVPRSISDLLEPKVDWRDEMRDFVTSSIKGKDEFTWRKLNKRQLVNDILCPSVENETIGELVVSIDTSGSIGGEQITEFATELVSICELCSPDKVRVLWWDTDVHGEQVFVGNYQDIAKLLKPVGGGGTHVSCVSEYINKERINAECVIVFTDGYVESDVTWNINSPTLWMVTENKSFEPPVGKKVKFGDD
jgi:predicted metal-dependent peptidase